MLIQNQLIALTVLETAKWHFYHVIYSDWIQNQAHQEKELLDYIAGYMNEDADGAEDNPSYANEMPSEYTAASVNIPTEYLASLRAEMQAKAANKRPAFGRKLKSAESEEDQASLID